MITEITGYDVALNGKLIDDSTNKCLKASAKFVNGKLLIRVEGYGDSSSYDGEGEPVVIEFFDNKINVVVWSDINKEDPTHKIDLENAKEKYRKKD